MRSRLPLFLGLAAIAAYADACSFLVSTAGLAEGELASANDAGPGADVEVLGDAIGIPGDGSSDGGDGATLPFCEKAAHLFCEDFDRPGVARWWSEHEEPGTDLVVVSERALTPPSALRAKTPRVVAGAADLHATLDKVIPGPWGHVILEFDVYLMPPAWEAGDVNFGLFCIGLNSDTVDDAACVSLSSFGTVVGVGGGYSPQGLVFPTGRWVHVRVDFDPAGLFRMEYEDDFVSRTFPAVSPGANPSTDLALGILAYNQPAPGAQAYFDNITVDIDEVP